MIDYESVMIEKLGFSDALRDYDLKCASGAFELFTRKKYSHSNQIVAKVFILFADRRLSVPRIVDIIKACYGVDYSGDNVRHIEASLRYFVEQKVLTKRKIKGQDRYKVNFK